MGKNARNGAATPLVSVEVASRCMPPDVGSESTIRHWIAAKSIASVKVGKRRLIRVRDLALKLGVEVEELTPIIERAQDEALARKASA